MSIDVVDNPFALVLDKNFFVENGYRPLYAGTDWALRFKVVDDAGAAVDLTDAVIAMHVKPMHAAEEVFTRTTADGEITIDDQTTAKGWFTVTGDETDEEALTAAAGPLHAFDIRVKTDGTERIVAAGLIEFLAPQTPTAAVN